MAKKKSSFEGQELAPMEPWRPEYAPQAISSGRHPASTIAAFVLAAGFGLSIGGAFASQAGILPPLGGTETAAVADQTPDASVDPSPVVDATPAPSDVPAVDPAPGTDPIVIPPPAGGDSDDEDDEDEDEDEDDEDDDDEEDEDEDEDGDDD
jgi:hypothetical protein